LYVAVSVNVIICPCGSIFSVSASDEGKGRKEVVEKDGMDNSLSKQWLFTRSESFFMGCLFLAWFLHN
jgi:hypothetical protein